MKRRVTFLTLSVIGVLAGVYAFGVRETAASTPATPLPVAPTPISAQPAKETLSVPAPQAAAASAAGKTSHATRAAIEFPVIERGVKYVPLNEQSLPAEWKTHLQAQLKNLRETGSLSRGKVTHEFASLGPMSENLQKKGLKNLLAQLAIEPSDLRTALGPSYVLVGADSQGKWVEKRGAAGFFQILRNVAGNQMIELSENQLDILGGDGTILAPEFHNDMVMTFPATLEQLVDPQGSPLHNLQWVAKDRIFHLTTRNMESEEVRQLATVITQRFVAMDHGGWRTAYDFDPTNPMHRIALPETKDKGRW